MSNASTTTTTAAAAAAGLARLIHHSQEHQELKSFGAVATNQSGQTVDLIRRVTAPATRATIIIYPTIPPEVVIIPIICSIVIFPLVVVTSICLLRYYNQRARAKERFRTGFQKTAQAMMNQMGGQVDTLGQNRKSTKKKRYEGTGLLSLDPTLPSSVGFNLGMPELELGCESPPGNASKADLTSASLSSVSPEETRGGGSNKYTFMPSIMRFGKKWKDATFYDRDEHCIQVEMSSYGEDANISKNAFDTSAKNNSPKVSRSPDHHKNQASFDPSQTVAVAVVSDSLFQTECQQLNLQSTETSDSLTETMNSDSITKLQDSLSPRSYRSDREITTVGKVYKSAQSQTPKCKRKSPATSGAETRHKIDDQDKIIACQPSPPSSTRSWKRVKCREDNFVVDNASTRGPRSINTNTQSSSRYEKFSAEVSRGRTSDHHSPHQSTTVLTTDKITAEAPSSLIQNSSSPSSPESVKIASLPFATDDPIV